MISLKDIQKLVCGGAKGNGKIFMACRKVEAFLLNTVSTLVMEAIFVFRHTSLPS